METMNTKELMLKLMGIKEDAPEQDENFHEFAETLGAYLFAVLTTKGDMPIGLASFIRLSETVINDLEDGFNRITGMSIKSKLVGVSPLLYAFQLGDIADMCLPAELAKEVRRCWSY